MITRLKTYIRESFFIKLLLSYTVVIFLMSSILAVMFIRHQTAVLRENLIHHGRLLTDMLANNARLGVFSENAALLADAALGVIRQSQVITVTIYNHELKRLMEKNKLAPVPPAKLTSADVAYEKNGTHLSETGNSLIFKAAVFSAPRNPKFSSPFPEIPGPDKTGKIIGHVRVTVSKKELSVQTRQMFVNAMSLALFFWLSGSALIFLVVRSATIPLKNLTNAVNRMGATGHLDTLEVATKDEIGKLAEAFNNMSASIRKREEEKESLEDQLRQAQKMEAIGTLAGGIAHDFNNIIGAIRGFAELGLLEAPEGSTLQERLKEIDVASNRAVELVRQILTFSRQKTEIISPISMATITKEVIKLLAPSIPDNVSVALDIAPDCGMVLSNAAAIHQIVMNLCTNALHAMKENGGTLMVTITNVNLEDDPNTRGAGIVAGSYQKLIVADDGYGIPKNIQDKIFDPFFTTKKSGEGTGMGLSVVHGIIKRHKGFMEVMSSAGNGTAFYIYLPLINMEEIPTVPTVGRPAPVGTGTLLLVDDDDQLAKATGGLLESLGYDVIVHTDSCQALNYFRAHPDSIDLVIIDIVMPGVSGTRLASEIQKRHKGFPMLLITGFSTRIDEKKALELGFKGLLPKPFGRDVLAVMVKKIMDENADLKE